MIYFLIILAILIVAAFLIPINVVINTNFKGENVYYVDNQKEKNKLTIVIKIMGFIPIYKYTNDKKNKDKSNTQKLTIVEIIDVIKESFSKEEKGINNFISEFFKWGKRLKYRKFALIGGFNTEDYVKNAYINATINSLLCMYINANQDNFNLNKLYYQVAISNYKYYLTLDTIIAFPLFHNIDVFKTIIRIVHKFKKKKIDNQNDNMQNENSSNNRYINMQ